MDDRSGARRGALRHRGEAWLVLCCIIVAAAPLVWVSMPPVMDLPNHLVRIWLLAGGAQLPGPASAYVVDWSQASTNVAVDWIAAQGARVLPFPVIDRLIRLLAFLGPALGTICLGKVLFGRLTAWSLVPLAFVWGTTSIAGFVNYSISLGAALLFAVLQYRMRRLAPAALAAHALFATALLLIHPFGLLFYLALMAGIVVGPDVPLPFRGGSLMRIAAELGAVTLIGLAPLIGLILFSESAPSSGVIVHQGLMQFHPRTLTAMALSPISTYHQLADLAFAAPLVLAVAAITVRRKWEFHFGLLASAVLLGVLAVLAPNEIGDAAWIDRRFPLMAALTLVAAIHPLALERRWKAALTFAALIAVAGKTAWITYVWIERQQDIEDLHAATRVIAAGDRILAVKNRLPEGAQAPLGRIMADTGNPVRAHLPTLLVMEKGALVPTLFAVPGQHPIRVVGLARSPERKWASLVPFAADLWSPGSPGHVPGWRCSYDYLLLLGADEPASQPLATAGLRLVDSQGFAALYAIERPGTGESCG